jgi:hypothetical protein
VKPLSRIIFFAVICFFQASCGPTNKRLRPVQVLAAVKVQLESLMHKLSRLRKVCVSYQIPVLFNISEVLIAEVDLAHILIKEIKVADIV